MVGRVPFCLLAGACLTCCPSASWTESACSSGSPTATAPAGGTCPNLGGATTWEGDARAGRGAMAPAATTGQIGWLHRTRRATTANCAIQTCVCAGQTPLQNLVLNRIGSAFPGDAGAVSTRHAYGSPSHSSAPRQCSMYRWGSPSSNKLADIYLAEPSQFGISAEH